MQRRLLSVAWGSSQAGVSLTIGATAWLLSGLTSSPLINGLLPALATLPLLLPLPQRIRLGYAIQLLSLGLLLLVAAGVTGRSLLGPLLGISLLATGLRMAQEPLQRQLHGPGGLPIGELRAGAEAGRLLGNLLTALLFPIGRALLQFGNALVLLLPLAPVIAALQARDQPHEQPAGGSSPDGTIRGQSVVPSGLLQGLLFGGLFALLPLWVRQQAEGNCFDFGLVLTAYGLGRTGAEAWGQRLRLPPPLPYLLMAGVLLATQWASGWGAVLLFLPFGLLAAVADARLAIDLDPSGDLQRNWHTLERSSALGGLAGCLGMGLVAQMIGLAASLPIQLVGFVGAGALLPLLARPGR
ncbi:MFS transporter [Synechococcus sp. CCY 9618]|uniref:MFS transporter n=1 Tax=Synechococcus sp. CCY 9618 TaxID=2815602 RepID=UPI001C24A00D|nr:MFS transporter [Synechococcus sp. CCY 9618]